MARGVNKVIIIGNLGTHPESRYLPSGGAVTNISIATTETWKNRDTGKQEERTEWHRVVFFNRLAEIAKEYLKKGSKIYIEGSLRTRKWQDRNGNDRYTTEIVANVMQMLDSRQNENNFLEEENEVFDNQKSFMSSESSTNENNDSIDFDSDDIPF